jgi:ubiquinone/menaquinone biosynthesis C-methylase UbiE
MGCGRAQISKHFTDKNDTRFQFINYDHVSSNETVISCDISSTPLENDSVEIVILSLAMWGSNCKTYIAEAHRILESNGLLYIIEATKRWSEKDENHNFIQGEEGGKLRKVLIENNFQVSESRIEKFSLFVCNKRQIN